MKRTSTYITIIALAMVSVLSSCAFIQKGEFAQRKYYNFPRTNHSVEQTAAVISNEKEVAQTAPAVQEEKKSEEPVLSASVNKKEIIVQKTEVKTVKHTVTSRSKVVSTVTSESPAISFKKSEIRKQAKKESRKLPYADAGMYMFLAVIAAIFFPPLGIYIKDHHTNKWFWITLLLCLAGGGLYLFYTGIFGLLYLVAIVIALMDVFDIL